VLRVTIVNYSGSLHCQAGCGWDWSQPEHLKLADERLQSRYGAKVQLDYVDLAQLGSPPLADCEVGELEEEAPFPRLVVNGRVKIAGDFDLRMLLDAVEVVAEMAG